ncbi:MAG: tape measure protein [Zoogloeaceae bacterium]|jgi:tape measure domain-containing protein|nr:tape measure protein [Zoogloeaceae bacterium]
MADDMQVKIKITGDVSELSRAARQGRDALDSAFGETGKAVQGTERALKSVASSADAASVSMDNAAGSAGSLWQGLSGLSRAFIGAAGVGGAGEIARLADEYGQMASRVKMATDSAEEFEAVQARLADTASKTYRPLAEAQEMFIRTSDAIKALGYNTQGVLDVSDSFSYLMVTNAASGERAASAISAFSRALQTGKIDAETWRSILAAVPSVLEDIAAATGKSADEIRRLGATGTLELEALTEALRKSLEKNAQAAKDMPTTVGDAFTALKNNLQAYIGAANEAGGYTEKFVKAVEFLAENVHLLAAAGFTALVGAMAAMGKHLASTTIAFAKAQVVTVTNASALRGMAQSALQAARAEMAAAEAALAHERAAIGLGTAVTGVAAAEARQTAAATALAAAERGAAAAKGAMSAAAGVAWRFLSGPWGIALATGISLLGVFKRDTDAATASQLDFSKSLEETAEQFKNLSRAQQGAEMARAETARKQTLADYKKAAKELHDLAKGESSWFRGKFDPEEIALDPILTGASAASSGRGVDFNRISDAIDRLGKTSEETKNKMRKKLGVLEDYDKATQAATRNANALKDAQAGQAKAEKPSGKPLESLARALSAARDAASELGVELSAYSSKVSPEFEQAASDLDALIIRFEKLESAGYDMGGVLEDAFRKTLEKTKNPADLNALVDKIIKLGEEGRIARPKMVELFETIKGKAREAGSEAATLRNEIDALRRQADDIRRGKAGYGAKAEEARRSGMSQEKAEAEAWRKARQAASDARFYAAATASAQMDGRAREALEYAERAKQTIEEADAAASRLRDGGDRAAIYDDLASAEASTREAEANGKAAQLDKMRAATQAQEEQLDALERRIDTLMGKAAGGASLSIDANGTVTAVEDVKARIDAIPDNTEKTITVTTVYKGDAGNAPPVGGDSLRGFSPGGWTGDVSPTAVSGLVHGREFVTRAAMVAQPGARRFLELFNRIGMAALPIWLKSIKLPGYARGGYVTPRGAAASDDRMLPAVFNFPGVGKVPVKLTPTVAEDLARTLDGVVKRHVIIPT